MNQQGGGDDDLTTQQQTNMRTGFNRMTGGWPKIHVVVFHGVALNIIHMLVLAHTLLKNSAVVKQMTRVSIHCNIIIIIVIINNMNMSVQ